MSKKVLDKQTIEFIIKLLSREIESEIIQNSPDITEIEYVNDLKLASVNFINVYGERYDILNLQNKLDELCDKKG